MRRKKKTTGNEWKYLISTSEKELLKLRLKPFLVADPHAKDGGYLIRSRILTITGTVRMRRRKPGC